MKNINLSDSNHKIMKRKVDFQQVWVHIRNFLKVIVITICNAQKTFVQFNILSSIRAFRTMIVQIIRNITSQHRKTMLQHFFYINITGLLYFQSGFSNLKTETQNITSLS